MKTPIVDFVRDYARENKVRFHMPGHKGKNWLGCELLDITEIKGADALYEAEGIIRESEKNATALFGTGATFYSTEGSSQCIRAMIALALKKRRNSALRPVIAATRNAHKAFLYACALLGVEILWLWDESGRNSLCRCTVKPETLERILQEEKPFAVYLTSPDYLGGMLDIKALAETVHRYGVPLLVDNAHGAYLHFLKDPCHPMDLGADLCCDSAHKTLPVLTGGAYLHVHKEVAEIYAADAKSCLALFGSTSPSYLILQSLDMANRYLSDAYSEHLQEMVLALDIQKEELRKKGWQVEKSDPLKLTLASAGMNLAEWLRQQGIECEYEDPDYTVMMVTPENGKEDLQTLLEALQNIKPCVSGCPPELMIPETVLSPREAMLRESERIPVEKAVGRTLAGPSVGCPPAVPVVVSGERISENALEIFRYYGITELEVIK